MVAYAFENFPLGKIYAPVFDFNIASQKVLQKAGFEREAILKQAAVKNGNILDLHYYSFIKQLDSVAISQIKSLLDNQNPTKRLK
jgi:RimJ/RimL family protein N-acetyltransferase